MRPTSTRNTQEEFYQLVEDRRQDAVQSGKYSKAHINFSPQNKLGEEVLRKWYAKK